MKYINEFFEGCRVSGIYLCKHRQSAVTKNGKPYENVICRTKRERLMEKYGTPILRGNRRF